MSLMTTDVPNSEYEKCVWRTGRKVGRTIYAQLSGIPKDDDPLIGVFDTIELAKAAVEAHNSLMTGSSKVRP
jgi:hypothetical protein